MRSSLGQFAPAPEGSTVNETELIKVMSKVALDHFFHIRPSGMDVELCNYMLR